MNQLPQSLRIGIALILFAFISLFVYTKLAGPIPFFINSVQTTKSDVFHVDGVGKAVAVPDTAAISAGVTKTAATVADAQSQTNTVVKNMLDSLKALGIETKDIQTTNYSVNPNYDFSTGKQTITGYTVVQNISVKIKPLDKVNKAVDTLTANGANLIGQVSFGFSDDMKKDLENQARQNAVANAKQKAQSLASASGIHLGKVIDVIENANQQVIQPMALNAMKAGTAASDTTVTPGENTVSLTVTLSYQTY